MLILDFMNAVSDLSDSSKNPIGTNGIPTITPRVFWGIILGIILFAFFVVLFIYLKNKRR